MDVLAYQTRVLNVKADTLSLVTFGRYYYFHYFTPWAHKYNEGDILVPLLGVMSACCLHYSCFTISTLIAHCTLRSLA